MAGSRPRFSAVSRSNGSSACARAAYRSAELIDCRTYGETFDYTRKNGVLHSEIMAPEHAPAWARDRQTLWNAVEQSEMNKDGSLRMKARLSRDVVVPLPHELDLETNKAMLREWIVESFVSRGMIADFSIHKPDRDGDDRNFHAHVALTVREITPDGFHAKKSTDTARDWNKVELLETSIDRWQAIQNRELERAGLETRVNFDSFEKQGIDHEPQQHEGPAATAKRRRGEESRVAKANDDRAKRNSARTDRHVRALKELAGIAAERSRFDQWADAKAGELRAQQALSRLDLTRELERESDRLEDSLAATYGPHLRTVQHEARKIETRLAASGVGARLRRLWSGRADRDRLDALKATIADTKQRMDEQRGKQRQEHAAELNRLDELQAKRRAEQQAGIDRAKAKKDDVLRAREDRISREGGPTSKLDPDQRRAARMEEATPPPETGRTPEREPSAMSYEERRQARLREALQPAAQAQDRQTEKPALSYEERRQARLREALKGRADPEKAKDRGPEVGR